MTVSYILLWIDRQQKISQCLKCYIQCLKIAISNLEMLNVPIQNIFFHCLYTRFYAKSSKWRNDVLAESSGSDWFFQVSRTAQKFWKTCFVAQISSLDYSRQIKQIGEICENFNKNLIQRLLISVRLTSAIKELWRGMTCIFLKDSLFMSGRCKEIWGSKLLYGMCVAVYVLHILYEIRKFHQT